MTHLSLSIFRPAAPLLAAAALAFAPPLRAQDTVAAGSMPVVMPATRTDAVSPLIEEGHWAVRAAARAEALGLATHYLPAQRSVPRAAVERALAEAAERAATERPELAPLAAAWHARFLEEFREFRPGSGWGTAPVAPLAGRWSLGARDDQGRVIPARGLSSFREPPIFRDDESRAFAASEIGVGVGRWAAANVELVGELGDGDEGLDAHRWEVAVGAGAWRLSAGEQAVGYGYGGAGGVVLSSTPMPRLELQTQHPVRLPWVLGRLGDASFETFVSRLDEARHPGDPWMWGARAAFQPHPRFAFAVNRASIFGGDSIDTPTDLSHVAQMVLGVLTEDFENQIVSLDFRWRVPSERSLPLTLYLEWGADDANGAWWDNPAISGGAYVAAIPGLPEVGAGAELTHVNGPWYLHSIFRGNWVRGDEVMGLRLGGAGNEAAVYARADLADARLRLDARGFTRSLTSTADLVINPLIPLHEGRSVGGALDAALRVTRHGEARLRFLREQGDGWHEQRVQAELGWLF